MFVSNESLALERHVLEPVTPSWFGRVGTTSFALAVAVSLALFCTSAEELAPGLMRNAGPLPESPVRVLIDGWTSQDMRNGLLLWSDENLCTVDLATGIRLPISGMNVTAIASDYRGRLVAIGFRDGRVVIRQGDIPDFVARADDERHASYSHQAPITSLACSPDGLVVVSGDSDGRIKLREESGKVLDGPCTAGSISEIAVSPAGRQVVVCVTCGGTWCWERATNMRRAVGDRPEMVRSIAFSPCGRWLVTGDFQGKTSCLDAATLELRWKSGSTATACAAVAVSPDARLVASDASESVLIWDLATGALVRELQGYHGGAVGFRFETPERLAALSRDGYFLTWDVESALPLFEAQVATDAELRPGILDDDRLLN